MPEVTDAEFRKLRKLVQALPGERGWWHKDAMDAWLTCAYQLRVAGQPMDAIEALLKQMYNAVKGEYGE